MDATFPPPAPSFSIFLGLFPPCSWQRDTLRFSEQFPSRAVSPHGGSLACALENQRTPLGPQISGCDTGRPQTWAQG